MLERIMNKKSMFERERKKVREKERIRRREHFNEEKRKKTRKTSSFA